MFGKALLVLALVVVCLGAATRSRTVVLQRYPHLLLLTGAGLTTYLLATNLSVANIASQPSTRFVAPFVVLLFVVLVSSLRVPTGDLSAVVLPRAATVGVAALSLALMQFVWTDLHELADEQPVARDIAIEIRGMGLKPGDAVAILGRKYDVGYDHEFWARLARVKIVGQVPVADEYLGQSTGDQEHVQRLLSGIGAKALVFHPKQDRPPGPDWHPLGFGYFVLSLPIEP